MTKAREVGFSSKELLRLVPGLKYQTLDYWLRTELLRSSVRAASGKGSVRRFSLADVVAARVIVTMRGSRVSLQGLRKVVARLQREPRRATHPLASTTLVVIPGDRPDVAKALITDDAVSELTSLLRDPGQALMAPVVLPLEPLVREVRNRVVELDQEREAREAQRLERERTRVRKAVRKHRARQREQRGAASG